MAKETVTMSALRKAFHPKHLGRRVSTKLRVMLQGRIKTFDNYLPYVSGKTGLEIGGPSGVFRTDGPLPLYEEIGQLDNCDYSDATVWANHSGSFHYSDGKPDGNTIFEDGSALVSVPPGAYEVVFSAHNLEHFANPVKALKEWQRVLSADGALVLVLPYYRETFDHRREPTSVDHMFEDFDQKIGEDDLTHLDEILERHDLDRDPGAGSREKFVERSRQNLDHRCLHHHVFDQQNSRDLVTRAGMEVLAVELAAPFHLCILARKRG